MVEMEIIRIALGRTTLMIELLVYNKGTVGGCPEMTIRLSPDPTQPLTEGRCSGDPPPFNLPSMIFLFFNSISRLNPKNFFDTMHYFTVQSKDLRLDSAPDHPASTELLKRRNLTFAYGVRLNVAVQKIHMTP